MPRPSIESQAIAINVRRARVSPRAGCSEAVAVIFRELVQAVEPDHFTASDAPLIESYAEAIAMSRRAYAELDRTGPVVDGRTSPWVAIQEKSHRSQVALSARLRVCPQSRFDRLKAGTTARKSQGGVDWTEI